MEIIYLLIPLSIILMAFAIWAFFWAVKSGQFDNLDSAAFHVLQDDQPQYEQQDKTPSEQDKLPK